MRKIREKVMDTVVNAILILCVSSFFIAIGSAAASYSFGENNILTAILIVSAITFFITFFIAFIVLKPERLF